MNHSHYKECFIPLTNTTIKSCKCYAKYWKELRGKKNPFLQLDYSVEKAFTYRKYFGDDKILYHFCINCLHEIIANVPMRIFEFELTMKGRAGCIFKYKHNSIPLAECCCSCINFVIHRFSSNFFIDV